MGWKHIALGAFERLGGFGVTRRWLGADRLTVLAYHRVLDHRVPGFAGFAANVSAGPDSFAQQMKLVAGEYNPVSIGDVAAAADGHDLPERALLVTFDDGYRDNHDVALPTLTEHSIPAVVFLATDHIGSGEPFWWDRVAWAFSRAESREVDLPLLGSTSWDDSHAATVRWVAAAKRLSGSERDAAVAALGESLGISEPGATFADDHLDWNMVRAMQSRGIDFGAHTCSHPILARERPERVRQEVLSSVERVAEETGRRPLGFAYPNGLPGDYTEEAIDAVRDAGISVAFTLSPGPARRREYVGSPLRIPRIYLHHKDDRRRFAAKLAGVSRLVR